MEGLYICQNAFLTHETTTEWLLSLRMIPDLQRSDPSIETKTREEVTAITAFIRERLHEKQIAGSRAKQWAEGTLLPDISAGGEEKAKSVYGTNVPNLQALNQKHDPECM